jgi:hypothetical protein
LGKQHGRLLFSGPFVFSGASALHSRGGFTENPHNLRGAFLLAGSAGAAFFVIDNRYAVFQNDALFRAVFNANPALDTAYPAGFAYRGTDRITVGAESKGYRFVAGNNSHNALGTFGDADFAAGTFCIVYVGKPIVAHGKRAETADPDTIPETDAAPGTEFGSSRQFCAPAGFKARVNSPGNPNSFPAKAAAYRHHRRYLGGAQAHNGGKRVGDGLASGGTAGYVAARGNGGGVTVTAGKAAAPAVRSGKGLANPAREGIFGNVKKFPEKTKGAAQNKGQDRGESRGYKNNNHDNLRPAPFAAFPCELPVRTVPPT